MKRIADLFGIGTSFRSRDFVGPVVVTDDALYMVVVNCTLGLAGTGAVIGGGLGGLLAAGVDKLLDKATGKVGPTPRFVKFGDLKVETSDLQIWKGAKPESDVLILPKEAVTLIKCSIFYGIAIDSTIGPFIFKMTGYGKAQKALAEYNWPV